MYYSFGTPVPPQSIPQTIARAQKILELIIKNKYFASAQLLYAKLKYLLSDRNFAMGSIQNVLAVDSRNLDAYTLYGMILIDNKDYVKCKEIINDALIQNLNQAKEHVYFMITKAKCELGLGDTDNAKKSLAEALKLFEKAQTEGTTGM
jgi:tetratricopeptide (TPR) repeat protein